MDKRIGVVGIVLSNREDIEKLNSILTGHSQIIIGRLGLPLKERNIQVISLIVEGDTDQIGSLTGKIGRLKGVQVKSVLTKNK